MSSISKKRYERALGLRGLLLGLIFCGGTFLLPQRAEALPQYEVGSNVIYDENGREIGIVEGRRAVTRDGDPLSKLGVTVVEGSDGNLYSVDQHDGGIQLAANSDNETSSLKAQVRALSNDNPASVVPAAKSAGSVARNPKSRLAKLPAPEKRDPLYAEDELLQEKLHPGATVLASTVAVVTQTGMQDKYSNDLLAAQQGWSQYFQGVRWSPIVTDLYKLDERYPEMMGDQKLAGGEVNRQQLGPLWDQKQELTLTKSKTIGIDDEVLKTSMAVYQPVARMQRDFLEDETAKDNYLSSALTVRGVAVMAMGFLDKTVGAGLVAIQQQADQNTIQQLLKQISWTSSKMANPDRAQVYRDTDEKVEACLEIALKDGKPQDQIKGKTRKIVDFKCEKTCGPAPTKQEYRAKDGKELKGSGNGSYAWCVCCGEVSSKLNKQYEDGNLDGEGNAKDKQNSIVERVFYGTNKPKGGTGGNASKVTDIIKYFKQAYGDVFLEEYERDGEPGFRYVYMFPSGGVPRWTRAFRNGCYTCDNPRSCPVDPQGGICHLAEEMKLKLGICPSLLKLLENWQEIAAGKKQDQETLRWLAEASMGHPLSAKTIEAILNIDGKHLPKLEGEPSDRMRRWMDAFCDSSALAAFTKFHARFSQIATDHLTLNQQASASDKMKLAGLVSRVTEQLALADTDISSSFAAEAAITGVNIHYDRDQVSNTAIVENGSRALTSMVAQRNSHMQIGTVAETRYNAGAGNVGRGTGAVGRDADIFDTAPDPISSALKNVQ